MDVDLNDSLGNRIDYDNMYTGNIWLPTSPQTYYFELDTSTVSPIDTYTVDVYFDTDDFGGTDGSQSAQVNLNPKGNDNVYVNAADIPNMYEEPGGSIVWNLTVKNNGNNPDTISIDVASALNWDTQLSSSSLNLDPNAEDVVQLTVTIPTNVAPATKDTATVTVTSGKDITKTDSYGADAYSTSQIFDISLSTIEENQTIGLDETASYGINIKNQGNYEDTISLSVTTFSGGNWNPSIDKASVTLVPSASTSATISVDTPSTYTSGDDKYSEVKVTATAKDGSTTEYWYFTTTIGLVDYTISDITFSNDNPDVDEEITITATIMNSGTVDASNVVVSFYHNSTLIDSDTINSIAKDGGSGDASIKWTAIQGYQTIEVKVDESEADPEFDDTDNTMSQSVTVNAPDLTITSYDIQFSNDYPNIGDEITITVTVTNSGTTDATNVVVDFGTIGEVTISLITKNNGQEDAEITWIPDTSGDVEITVSVDLSNNIKEINENNNIASKTISVNEPPIASISAGEADTWEIELGNSITFDGSASTDNDGTIDGYYFDFGNGQNTDWTTTSKVTHLYTTTGTYTVTLKVKDDNGAESSVTTSVTIVENPPPTKSIISQPPKSDIKKEEITLAWSKNVDDDFDLYEIHMSTDQGFTPSSTTLLTTISDQNGTSYTATGLNPGKKYYFKIRTIDNVDQSTDSDEMMVKSKKKAEDAPGFEFGLVLLAIVVLSVIIRKRKHRHR